MRDKLKSTLHQLQPVTLLRLSDDLRKAAYLMGIGIVGVILPSDDISFLEGILLFLFGLVMWIIGHLCAYSADIKSKNDQGDTK